MLTSKCVLSGQLAHRHQDPGCFCTKQTHRTAAQGFIGGCSSHSGLKEARKGYSPLSPQGPLWATLRDRMTVSKRLVSPGQTPGTAESASSFSFSGLLYLLYPSCMNPLELTVTVPYDLWRAPLSQAGYKLGRQPLGHQAELWVHTG